MADKLLPCPFCGSDDLGLIGPLAPAVGRYPRERYAHCRECGASGPLMLRDKAVAAWNARDLDLAAHMIETRRRERAASDPAWTCDATGWWTYGLPEHTWGCLSVGPWRSRAEPGLWVAGFAEHTAKRGSGADAVRALRDDDANEARRAWLEQALDSMPEDLR